MVFDIQIPAIHFCGKAPPNLPDGGTLRMRGQLSIFVTLLMALGLNFCDTRKFSHSGLGVVPNV